jgi:hypothetical protein
MKPHLRAALCFLSLASFSVPLVGADITPEEQTVRTTFAKLVFAIQVKTVESALSSSHSLDRAMLQKALQHNQLQFELSGFSSGDFSEISNRSILDFISVPRGEAVLSIGGSSFQYKDETGKLTQETSAALPLWQPGPTVTGDFNATMAEVLAANHEDGVFERYAALTVKVSFHGQSRQYPALFLFGKDSTGGEKVLIYDDGVISGGGLQDMVTVSVYPAVLLETKLGEDPAVRDWLSANQMPASSCPSDVGKICCDLETLKCGLSAEDLRRPRATRADQPLPRHHPEPGPSEGILVPSITDGVTGKPILDFQLRWYASGNHRSSRGSAGFSQWTTRTLVPASEDVWLEVSARGYRTWVFADPSDPSRPACLHLQPGVLLLTRPRSTYPVGTSGAVSNCHGEPFSDASGAGKTFTGAENHR